MKSSIRNFAVATFVALASLAPAMHAQLATDSARVNVPFSFDYGKTHFAHGVYTITMTGMNVLTVRSRTESAMAVVRTAFDPGRRVTSQAIFKKYGDRWFLEEVRIAGGPDITVNESAAEKSAASELAQRGSQPATLALAFLPERGN